MPARRSVSAAAGVVAALVLTAGAVTLLPGAAPQAAAQALVPYDSCDALLAHYRDQLARTATPYGAGGLGGDVVFASGGRAASEAGAPVAASGGDTALSSDDGATGPTGTNLQESGVDEPDSAKTSGGLLLAVGQGRLQVVRTGAVPPDEALNDHNDEIQSNL